MRRESPERDRRVITLGVTPPGKGLAGAVYAEVAARRPEIAAGLGDDDPRQLERIVDAPGAR